MNRVTIALWLVCLTLAAPRDASALITGGVGNTPLHDPGWPKGAAGIFNHPGRVAWWEGPPFGGGQWHSECRGDAKALTAVLADFAKMDAATKRVILHDGDGLSFWLAPNREPEKLAAARVDWVFVVWVPSSWDRLRRLPADLNPTGVGETSPPSQIDVYTGNLRWEEVTVPKGLTVDDQRMSAHGFTPADGVVFEGHAVEVGTSRPVAARVTLQRVEPQKTGGYRYPTLAETHADAQGRWVFRNVPAGWVRVVVEADGFAPRVAGYAQLVAGPHWQKFDAGLARPAAVSGRVTDESGAPLAGVRVTFGDLSAGQGGRYELPDGPKAETDAEGRYRVDTLPAGRTKVWVNKEGYVRPGLGLEITTPKEDVDLRMTRAASARVSVDFAGKPRPPATEYMITMQPEGGDRIGSYGGSGQLDENGGRTFADVPPGRYTFWGQPNPMTGDQRTERVTADLKPGETTNITVKAR